MIRQRHSIWRDRRGSSVIELALVAPILAALLVGVVDISRAVSTKVQLEQAAQRAIELAQRSDYATSMNATLKSEAATAAGVTATTTNPTVTAWLECSSSATHLNYDTGTCNSGVSYRRYVNITVQKSFTPLFGTRFFPGATNGAVTVKGSATVRTQ